MFKIGDIVRIKIDHRILGMSWYHREPMIVSGHSIWIAGNMLAFVKPLYKDSHIAPSSIDELHLELDIKSMRKQKLNKICLV